ncbi:speriolin isoform X2 [Rattus norvegicus]|uniref:speriolin isoform X2 n=1 Tax=Rattus norvegicus TaxID=10116 RepID=UPI001917470C|nr:speriolin isoform X2 [Rattus norvegicus]
MSLLTNYEGLRHQIERLVRENEELKKLVRLIRENHELKSAIKTQVFSCLHLLQQQRTPGCFSEHTAQSHKQRRAVRGAKGAADRANPRKPLWNLSRTSSRLQRVHQFPTRPVLNPHSPPHNLPFPPCTSSSSASVNDARGSRVAEQSRKNAPETERKATSRKSNKLPDSCRDSKQLARERLVGEIAFQLDRRILSSIFPERVRLYGFTVSNIPEKIIQASLNPSSHKLDEDLCQTLTQRYVSIMNRLQSLGYNGRVHPALTEQLVNAYGILRERPELAASEGGTYSVDFLQRVLVETVHPSMLTDALLLLSCLNQLSHDDGKPMFIW